MEMSLRQVSRTTRAAQVVKRLLYEVEKFSGGVKPHDDLTLVVIRVL
jgi:serine phosphatase RsbU (regulator of sigma subunit)